MTHVFVILVALFFVIGFIVQISFVYYHFYVPYPRREHQEKATLTLLGASVTDIKTDRTQPPLIPVSTSNSTENSIPPIVKAWRSAKLDWHQLLPRHSSTWERFGSPEKQGKLRLLVAKEVQITDFLTRFHESGLSATYGKDFGILQPYSGCDFFSSPCVIHDLFSCQLNQLCEWSNDKNICVDTTATRNAESCSNPQTIIADSNGVNSFQLIMPSKCDVFVDQPAVILSIDSESQAMFYHWWASFNSLYSHVWLDQLKSNRHIHFFVNEINDPMFFHFFGLLSDFCWRRVSILEMPSEKTVCFCNVRKSPIWQGNHDKTSVQHIVNYLGLQQVQPPSNKIKIGLISRRRKRFILNEYELFNDLTEKGYEAVLLPLEMMTLHEQIRELRSLDVLIGIHGSALDNAVFMNPQSVIVQLLAFNLNHVITFPDTAKSASVIYQDWHLTDVTKTVFHWDLFLDADTEKFHRMSKEDIIKQGSSGASYREIGMFWINQDIIVPLPEWHKLVQRAVDASPGSKRIANIKS